MPILLDAIPEEATKISRPSTQRWLFFLIVLIVAWIGLILWRWTSERSGYIFWATMLGPPLCLWGLLFNLRRYAYKVEIIAAEARNTAREKLIQYEVERGQRGAWILGTYVETALGNSASILLAAATHSPPAISFSTPRGSSKPVKYAALTAFQNNLSHQLTATISKLVACTEERVASLPSALSCRFMLDCDSDLYPLIEPQLKRQLRQQTGRIFCQIPTRGTGALDSWLDSDWNTPGLLLVVAISLPASPDEGQADAITMMLLSNRKVDAYPDALRVHRPESGTDCELTQTLSRALLWAMIKPDELCGSWYSGKVLTDGSSWYQACEQNRVTFSLVADNYSIDPILGHCAHATPWLAMILGCSALAQPGGQVIAVQPAADKDEVWVSVITRD